MVLWMSLVVVKWTNTHVSLVICVDVDDDSDEALLRFSTFSASPMQFYEKSHNTPVLCRTDEMW